MDKSLCYSSFGWDGDDRVYILDERYGPEKSDLELLEDAESLIERYGKGDWYCDPSEPRMRERSK